MLCAKCLTMMAVFGSVIRSTHSSDTQGPSFSSTLRFNETCMKIASCISKESQVFYPGSSSYQQDISHWASSSNQTAACSLEPGTTADVGIALRILGETKTPFAVKGGGHATNPTFSSTNGVQIAMSRFSDVIYDPEAQEVTIGTGMIWDDVYAALEPSGVTVVGGRVPGVGVAGFTLGGGYSWLTNQYGLTIDTVQSFELVMPNGTVHNVTQTSSPDLFFALKGGQNNFVYVEDFSAGASLGVEGGIITYNGSVVDQVNQAVVNFSASNTDPKAVILPTYNFNEGALDVTHIIFYDASTPPPDTFDMFLAISSLSSNVSTRPYLGFVKSLPANDTYGYRGIFNSVSVTDYSYSFLQTVVNETTYWGEKFSDSAFLVSYDVEPFLSSLFTHNSSPSAYPPDRTVGLFPLNIYFAWQSAEFDQVIQDATRTSAQTLQAAAINDGDSFVNAAIYPNYAIFDTPLVQLYGANVPRLREIRTEVDPENVMELAGGFKL